MNKCAEFGWKKSINFLFVRQMWIFWPISRHNLALKRARKAGKNETKIHQRGFGIIFLFIGVAFLLMGVGLWLHILKPDHTEGNPAFWFPVIGGSMFLVGFVLFLWGYLWVRRQKNLQREGILVEGKNQLHSPFDLLKVQSKKALSNLFYL